MITFLNSSVFTQKREITESEFEKITSQAKGLAYDGKWRVTMNSAHFEKDFKTPVKEISEISEGENNTRRYLRVEKNRDVKTERERIVIGDIEYTRASENPWTKLIRESSSISGTGGISARGDKAVVSGTEPNLKEKTFKYFYIGEEVLDGQKNSIYESRKFRSYQLRPDWNYSYTIVEQFWISKDGQLFKQTSQTIDSKNRLTLDIIWRYEHPTDIKIEAPIK